MPKFNLGDQIRFIYHGVTTPFGCSFTIGKVYEVGGHYHAHPTAGRVGVVKDDHGQPNGWEEMFFDLAVAASEHKSGNPVMSPPVLATIEAPQMAIIPPHDCADPDNLRTYDSGWSRYDYCNICDHKIKNLLDGS